MVSRNLNRFGLMFQQQTIVASAHALKTLGQHGLTRVMLDLGLDHDYSHSSLDARANALADFTIKNPDRTIPSGKRLDLAVVSRAAHLLESTHRSRDLVLAAQPGFAAQLHGDGIKISGNHEDNEFDRHGDLNLPDPAVDVYRPFKMLPPDYERDGGFEEGDQSWPGDEDLREEAVISQPDDRRRSLLGMDGNEARDYLGETSDRLPVGSPRVVSAAAQIGNATSTGVGAVDVPFVGKINGDEKVSARLISDIWIRNGFAIEQLDKVDRELSLMREFAVAFVAAKSEFGRSHNNPPELVDVPEIDIAAIDSGLAAISVVRTQLENAEPDTTLLELIWRTLEVCSGTIGRFCRWVGEKTASKAGQYIDNIFDEASKALGKSIGTPHGITAWGIFICGVANGQEKDLKFLVSVIKAVGTALGHH